MRAERFQKTARSSVFFLRRPPNFENVTLVARRKEHFWGFVVIFLVGQLPPKRGILVETDARKGLFGHRCAQPERPSWWFWFVQSEARNVIWDNGCAQGMGQVQVACNLHLGCVQPLESPWLIHHCHQQVRIRKGLGGFLKVKFVRA